MALLPERANELRRHVEWVGIVPRGEIAAHYQWADVFLLPSLCEGSATVTYEALGAGLPVVVTLSSGSIVEHGVSGFCIPERDAETIVSALESFLSQPDLLRDMSAAARRRSREASLEAYGERLMAVTQSAQDRRMAVSERGDARPY
jgi:glycosyltransferase involved in cell wall biosynthesis